MATKMRLTVYSVNVLSMWPKIRKFGQPNLIKKKGLGADMWLETARHDASIKALFFNLKNVYKHQSDASIRHQTKNMRWAYWNPGA